MEMRPSLSKYTDNSIAHFHHTGMHNGYESTFDLSSPYNNVHPSYYHHSDPTVSTYNTTQQLYNFDHIMRSSTRSSVEQRCSNELIHGTDSFVVKLANIQKYGNKAELQKIKGELEDKLAATWFFGKQAIRDDLEKVNAIYNARITQLLCVIKNGTDEEALKAIKEVRRLSANSYTPHGINLLNAAEYLYEDRYVQEGQVRMHVMPGAVIIGFDTPIPTELLSDQSVVTNSNTDFHIFTKETMEIIAQEAAADLEPLRRTTLFVKGVIEGAIKYCKEDAQNPSQFVQNFILSNAELLKQAALLFFDIGLVPNHEDMFDERYMQMYKETVQSRVESFEHLYNKAIETIPKMSQKDWEDLTSRFVADYLEFKVISTGVNAVRNVHIPEALVENPLVKKIEQALSKHPEMVTTEGVRVKVPHAESEMPISKYTANGPPSGGDRKTPTVANMGCFFETDFGKSIKKFSRKLNPRSGGQGVYKVTKDISDYLQEGYHYCLDTKHYNHLEVYGKKGKFKWVLNLDGTCNDNLTTTAKLKPRKIDI